MCLSTTRDLWHLPGSGGASGSAATSSFLTSAPAAAGFVGVVSIASSVLASSSAGPSQGGVSSCSTWNNSASPAQQLLLTSMTDGTVAAMQCNKGRGRALESLAGAACTTPHACLGTLGRAWCGRCCVLRLVSSSALLRGSRRRLGGALPSLQGSECKMLRSDPTCYVNSASVKEAESNTRQKTAGSWPCI